jgi:tRNA threonylcarbamoyl adenosine modification protein (Sua5/YciO/YrdC/YwlC family)
MNIITPSEFKIGLSKYLDEITDGQIFIHPTDTIYGIGCDATNDDAVKKLRECKDRPLQPFSIIAPSNEWIEENCILDGRGKEWLDKLPGPYTLILTLKDPSIVSKYVNPRDDSTVAVRRPKHWFSQVVKMLNSPIITTCVNQLGKEFMTSTENLDPFFKDKVSFFIDEGEIEGSKSDIIHLTADEVKITKR